MLTVFAVIVIVVVLFWWIGSSAYAIAKCGDPTGSGEPDERLLSWRETWILGKRPDWSDSDEDWQKWNDKYKGKIDSEYFMPERFKPKGSE
jgi:hypothetical protein